MRIKQLALIAPVAFTLLGVPTHAEDTNAAIAASAQAAEAQVVAWRRDIHEHPELGNRETRTSALVAKDERSAIFDSVRTRKSER